MELDICHQPTPVQEEQLQHLSQAYREADAALNEISNAINRIANWYGFAASSADRRLVELKQSMSNARSRLDDVQGALNRFIESENIAYDFSYGGPN